MKSKQPIKNIITIIVVLILTHNYGFANNFSTLGNGIRNTVSATIQGKTCLYISELDGVVRCYTLEGEELWYNSTDHKAVLFEIVAADVDNDGNDDVLVASGDGNIYCWKSDGSLLWKFNPGFKVRFSEVAFLKNNDTVQIFAGGNNYILYELNDKGKLVSETEIKGAVRKLEAGNFISQNKQSLFLMTYHKDKFSWNFFGFLDAENKTVIKSKESHPKSWNRFMLNDFEVADIDKDGLDDLLLFGHNAGARFYALNSDFEEIASFEGASKDVQRYAHGFGSCLLPLKDQVVIQFGGVSYLTNLKGELIQRFGKKHRGIIFNDLVYEPKSHQLIGAGQIGGGNGLYFTSLDSDNWWKKEHALQGRMLNVENNLNELYQQALNFKLPDYQTKSEKSFNMITKVNIPTEVSSLQGGEVNTILQVVKSENTDRSELVEAIGPDALKKDGRRLYNKTREEIVNMARSFENDKKPFALWAGHVTDPFYIHIKTIELIMEVAPTMCQGFIYAEMANPEDPRNIHFVKEYMPRIAIAIRNNNSNAKVYFRYKNMFWGATCHEDLWKSLFFSKEYSDILVPSAEDTNNRLQDINFTGRVGMFASKYVNDFAMRLVDDNPTSWRPLSPGGQRSISPYLRNGAIMAAYGSRYGIVQDIAYIEGPGMNILFALMTSGVLPIVEPEDILSIGSWHLIKDVDKSVVKKADDGHNLLNYTAEDEFDLFSVNSVTWCGTNIPEHDYSKVSLGVEYRWLNFLPPMPHGMVPITAVEAKDSLPNRIKDYCISDTKYAYNNGKKVSAKLYKSTMEQTVIGGSKKMPVLVTGASWSAIKLDSCHIRLIMIDPGYIDPQEREVNISFQGQIPIQALDILSKENISINGQNVKLTIPAGSMRFVDLEYEENISINDATNDNSNTNVKYNADQSDLKIYPNPFSNNLTINIGHRNEYTKMEVLNLTGKVFVSKDISASQKQLHFDSKNLSLKKGTYIIRLSNAQNTVIKKTIKI